MGQRRKRRQRRVFRSYRRVRSRWRPTRSDCLGHVRVKRSRDTEETTKRNSNLSEKAVQGGNKITILYHLVSYCQHPSMLLVPFVLAHAMQSHQSMERIQAIYIAIMTELIAKAVHVRSQKQTTPSFHYDTSSQNDERNCSCY